MKRCTKCNNVFDYSFFHRDKNRKDGYYPLCKSCKCAKDKIARKTPRAKELANKRMIKYRNTDKYKETSHQYYIENKDTYRERDREYGKLEHVKKYRAKKQKEYRERNKIKEQARSAVYYALKVGTLIKPTRCFYCGKEGLLEAHHHLGYSKEHWLDVLFMHKRCHLEYESK